MECLEKNIKNSLEQAISNYKAPDHKTLNDLCRLVARRNDLIGILKLAKFVIFCPFVIYIIFLIASMIFNIGIDQLNVVRNLFVSSAVACISMITIYRSDRGLKEDIDRIYRVYGLNKEPKKTLKSEKFTELSEKEYNVIWFLCRKNDVLKQKLSEMLNSERTHLTYFDYEQLKIKELSKFYYQDDEDGKALFKLDYISEVLKDIKEIEFVEVSDKELKKTTLTVNHDQSSDF